MEIYEVRDPIYGFISFNEWEREIINHPVFQRLRRIKQLALTDYVYPGAMHTRFEHSIGVMHLATLMYDKILENERNKILLKDDLDYDEDSLKKDRQLIRLAALLHDVGHTPFSHASEEIMPINEKTNKPFRHEDYTVAIIRNYFKKVIEDHPIYNIKADEVAGLIEGNAAILGKRLFWKVIISSQLDADRGDYLLRDSHHIGVKYGVYDYLRLLNTLTLGKDPEAGDVVMSVDEGGWHVAESIVIARYQMFTQVYFHKTRRAYDYHLKEALKTVLTNGKFPDLKNIDKFLSLDDFIIWNTLRENKEDFHCKSILNRQHSRAIHETPETPDKKDIQELEDKKNKLKKQSIDYYEDTAESLWYKLNLNEESNKEILVINKKTRQAQPLSIYSSIVRNMGSIKQIRIYVKPTDKEKAERIIK